LGLILGLQQQLPIRRRKKFVPYRNTIFSSFNLKRDLALNQREEEKRLFSYGKCCSSFSRKPQVFRELLTKRIRSIFHHFFYLTLKAKNQGDNKRRTTAAKKHGLLFSRSEGNLIVVVLAVIFTRTTTSNLLSA
jgi:hypothetical protein